MMYWGGGMGGWGMVLMTVSTLLFWGLIIAGVAALVRSTSRSAPQGGPGAEVATPEHILAERFARGEIDEEEYTRRLAVLGFAVKTRSGG
ncbi:putative membrane protein [Krasilnikovia cinnamomea]|uniref:Putative membrane protein n=1 Tax=Krasilnikovia cinnamomea TaxID=349313 RepID=A0A4V2G7M7_9ACTN|nr:SHOCT domain-containing protein [Krasilnikovia cinnamomea]RZU53206.1 putative membrane protein [Krasilnikovia cinnamomea]